MLGYKRTDRLKEIGRVVIIAWHPTRGHINTVEFKADSGHFADRVTRSALTRRPTPICPKPMDYQEVTETAPQLQPLYLLADSQLLFWKPHGRLLLEAAIHRLDRSTAFSAAYIG